MQPTTTTEPVIDALSRVFRKHGYEAATLSILSAETGLKRSSLYHRFPGGKLDMAKAVLAHAGDTLGGYVFSPLAEDKSLASRTDEVIDRICEFYNQGKASCLLEALTVSGNTEPELLAEVEAAGIQVREVLSAIAQEAGKSKKQAAACGVKAFVLIQGSLVVARISGDPAVFIDSMRDVRGLLLT